MPSIHFKLMGIIGDKGERQLLIDSYDNPNVKEVKEMVKKEFKIVPNAKIAFLVNGKRFGDDDDHLPFKRLPIDPRKDKVTVIVSNPYS